MSAIPQSRYSPQEYLALERAAETKSEYYRGEIFAMTGASVIHNRVVANLIRHLGNALVPGGCEVYPSDLRVATPNGLYTYPDVTVICGEHTFDDHRRDTLTNPQILIEVLSESTEAYDRGKKFELYRSLPSLLNYILVEQTSALVYCYHRQKDADHWSLTFSSGRNAVLELVDFSVSLPLSAIYQNVEFPETGPVNDPFATGEPPPTTAS